MEFIWNYISQYLINFIFILEHSVISPWRWLAAVVIPLIFLFWGLRKKSLDISGGILGSEKNIICYDRKCIEYIIHVGINVPVYLY